MGGGCGCCQLPTRGKGGRPPPPPSHRMLYLYSEPEYLDTSRPVARVCARAPTSDLSPHRSPDRSPPHRDPPRARRCQICVVTVPHAVRCVLTSDVPYMKKK